MTKANIYLQILISKMVTMEVNTADGTAVPPLFTTDDGSTYVLRQYHNAMYTITITVQVLVCVLGVFSNTLLCATVIRFKRLRSPFNGLMFCLSAGNFFASSIAMPVAFILARYQHVHKSINTFWCPISIFLLNLFKWHSVSIMAEIAIIRARNVCSSTRWKPSAFVVLAIEIVNVITTVMFALYRIIGKNNICVNHGTEKSGHFLLNICVFLTLYSALVAGYVILSMITHRFVASLPRYDDRRKFVFNRFEIATLRASGIIVMTYLILHLPYIGYNVLLYAGVTEDRSYYTHSFFVSIFSLSNVTDTIMLLMTSPVYRKHVFLLLGLRRPTVHPVVM